ncbi:hypothetical protein NDU88_002419 [Pleurodeles waltl]|uniref:DDE Tnp4 domain-containing protein n=1 Tax=Pleurodeles waltl TaxID=8319 RepID=A0AAV7TKI2_PLEWA|nr:hypothetical protein NDU88_002419 [Pleurodeles waltl]
MNVQMVCLVDQYISHVNAKYPGSVHDAFILRNSSIPNVMAQLQRHRVWLIGDSGYPNLSWLVTPVKNARTKAEECYNEEEEVGDPFVAAMDAVDNEDVEAEDEDEDNRTAVIRQYFQ